MINKACDAIEYIMKNNNIDRSMSAINSETIWKPKEEKSKKETLPNSEEEANTSNLA
jgi:hypothetical protein